MLRELVGSNPTARFVSVFTYGRVLWGGYSVVVAPNSVKVVVWDRNPLFTPKNFYATLADVVIAAV